MAKKLHSKFRGEVRVNCLAFLALKPCILQKCSREFLLERCVIPSLLWSLNSYRRTYRRLAAYGFGEYGFRHGAQ